MTKSYCQISINHEKKELSTASQRLKYIRSLLKVSRSYLQQKYNIPEVTLKSWENGTVGLTALGVKRCVEMYLNEGIIVSEDWILEGMGLDPTVTLHVNQYFAIPENQMFPIEDDEVGMIQDADTFKKKHPNAVIMLVSNNEMRPFFKPGDYVAGKMRYGEAIETAINKNCIVYLKNGERFFRRVIKNSLNGYNLTCLNPDELTAEPVLYDVEIEGVAPIIWHRWKDV